MQKPARPADDPARIAELHRYGILDTLPEQAYDDLLAVAAGICGTPMGSVSLVDTEREWFKAALGVRTLEGARDTSFCGHTILDADRVMVVNDVRKDPRFHDNPRVLGEPNIRFYAGAPLVSPEGYVTGALCVMDREPRELDAFQCESLRSLSRQVVALMELRRANRQLQHHLKERDWYEQQLQAYQHLLEQQNDELAVQLGIDALTGLASRRAFAAELDRAISRAALLEQPLALAVIDIDHFKIINDTHGHPAGDRVLAEVGQQLRRLAAPPLLPARQGGEEFVLLMPDSDLASAGELAERLCRGLRKASLSVPITVSIGVAAWRVGESAHELYARADGALYAAKRGGRDRVVIAG